MSRRAAIYCRISRDRVGAGLGVERQEQDCRQLAEQLGWDVVAVHVDNDISAYSGKPRPGYQQLLADIEQGRADAVLAWHTDRLHRSPTELERYIDACNAAGAPTRTVTAGDLDLSTPSGRLNSRLAGVIARHEVEHMIERTTRAKAQAAADGLWLGGRRPFGYEADGVTVRAAEAAVVRDTARRLLLGESLNSITAQLNRGRIPTSTGGTWSGKAVRDVMLRARNAGIAVHKGREIGPARWPGLLDEDTWRAVRALLNDPARGAGRPGPPARHLGSGLYLCGVCDSPVLASLATGAKGRRRWTVYRCRATRAHIGRRIEPVDEYVTTSVHRLLARGDLPWDTADPAEIARLRVAEETQSRLLQEADDAWADEAISAEQWRRTSGRVGQRLEEIREALGRLATPSPVGGLTPEAIVATWDDLPLATRKSVIDAFAVVRLQSAPRGRRPGGGYFDRASVQIDWR